MLTTVRDSDFVFISFVVVFLYCFSFADGHLIHLREAGHHLV